MSVALLALRPDDEPVVADCRVERGASWCATPSDGILDPTLVRLVHDYCPRLRALPVERVLPQPLELLDLAPRAGDLARRDGGPSIGSYGTERSESVLLGAEGRLAWVVRRDREGRATGLQVICTRDTTRVPVLVLTGAQLGAALTAVDAGRALDLRAAARLTARAVEAVDSGQRSLGTFRCRTGPAALSLEPRTRFTCELQVFTGLGQGNYRFDYVTTARAPYLRLDEA